MFAKNNQQSDFRFTFGDCIPPLSLVVGISDQVDEIMRHEPAHCQGCGHDISDQKGEIARKKQAINIPPSQMIGMEHQSIIKRCPCCGGHSSGELPDDFKGNVQYGYRLRALVNYLIVYQPLPYDRTKELLKVITITPSTRTLHQMLQDGYA